MLTEKNIIETALAVIGQQKVCLYADDEVCNYVIRAMLDYLNGAELETVSECYTVINTWLMMAEEVMAKSSKHYNPTILGLLDGGEFIDLYKLSENGLRLQVREIAKRVSIIYLRQYTGVLLLPGKGEPTLKNSMLAIGYLNGWNWRPNELQAIEEGTIALSKAARGVAAFTKQGERADIMKRMGPLLDGIDKMYASINEFVECINRMDKSEFKYGDREWILDRAYDLQMCAYKELTYLYDTTGETGDYTYPTLKYCEKCQEEIREKYLKGYLL